MKMEIVVQAAYSIPPEEKNKVAMFVWSHEVDKPAHFRTSYSVKLALSNAEAKAIGEALIRAANHEKTLWETTIPLGSG